MHYHDFILQFGEAPGGGYTVHVESPAGQGEGSFELPWGRAPRVMRNLSAPVAAAPPASPLELGAQLFEALFQGEVRQLFDQSWGQVKVAPDQGLRLQIRLNPRHRSSFELAEIPWELLYRADTEQFLALSRKTPISRHLIVPQAARPLVAPSPLRILAVMSNPEGTVPLALQREREALEAAFSAGGSVEVDFRTLTTAAALRQALLREAYPVLHFMGHGEFAPGQGEGWLLFEDEDGQADPVPGRQLADELRDCPSLQVVLLNACSTGRFDGSAGRPFAGVAAALVMAGVPAVVAMRAPVSDRGAIAFSAHLYRHLAEGDPLDAAVAEGRLAVQRTDRRESEWSIPVLFLRHGGAPAVSPGQPAAKREPVAEPQQVRQAQGPRKGNDQPEGDRRASPRPGWVAGTLVSAMLVAAILGGVLARGNGWWPFAAVEESSETTGSGSGEAPPGEGTVSPESGKPAGPQPPPVDLRQLQAPPYQEQEVRLYVHAPAAASVDTSGWAAQAEGAFSRGLASLGLQLEDGSHAAWLISLELHPPTLTSQRVDGRDNQVCRLRAEYEFLHERNPQGGSRSSAARVGQPTADRACEIAVQQVAEQVGQEFLAVYLGE